MEGKCDKCGAKAVGGYDKMYVKFEYLEDGRKIGGDPNPDFGVELGEELCADCLAEWKKKHRT